MSASNALRRTSGMQLQFARPWAGSRLPATTVPGTAPATNPSLNRAPALHRAVCRTLVAPWNLSRTLASANANLH